MAKILVIDDEKSIRNALTDILEFEKHQVDAVENGLAGLEKMQAETYDVIFSDIKMPQMDGLELLQRAVEMGVETPIVMISGHGNIETAVESIKKGAYDFIEKPIDLNRLLVVVRNALDKKTLVAETKKLKKKIGKQYEMIGESEPIKHLRAMIERVAPTDARILITGDNGTGKEVVARQIYQLSHRSQMPFVEVNCAAIPSELIESELFGHEKGAFTSAIKNRIGKFEQADKGTIFLDEIGDMSLSAQAKVLRCLQESVISPVGSDKNIKIDVRVIAATNKDLRQEIEKGNFREDLFHRLNVIPIHVASLQERIEDIPLLVDYFTEQICQEQGIALKRFNDSAMAVLKAQPWCGNIRELRNVVERLIILGDHEISGEMVKLYI
ncbi:MAG: sigma-54-dependent Fis family transcriptional regulator [Paludibacteraceae bacterium]|jgi:DNA-binding NtrC family response regulator|nr:sigma-54-dependent Fis family transcriptional regulator [Paludibacteraceae bacterium]MDI9536689.1 sigma-54 dependent transcriptional regulator [Bacteroidota bacterium]HHT61269.1 sigma-54-dependent Fis family transcriptional regulator [Bacteroidales bacterium]MBP9039234.1 sigma-54-dependent Fis family transcriptional regulator [Paludibacteraceae bacterium]HOA46317.1 sigma-54 dependent transcriptional regulator [Paludibacteraceae bacterium]